MATGPFQLRSLMGLGGNAGVQGEPAVANHAVLLLLIHRRRRERLQGEGLFTALRSHDDPLGDAPTSRVLHAVQKQHVGRSCASCARGISASMHVK